MSVECLRFLRSDYLRFSFLIIDENLVLFRFSQSDYIPRLRADSPDLLTIRPTPVLGWNS